MILYSVVSLKLNTYTSFSIMKYYIGEGFVNDAINNLPFELHIPAGLNKKYNYCGPGTKLQERLLRGDKPINGLDAGCMEHDIAYHNSKELTGRHEADRKLAQIAMQRFRAKDATWGEKMAALGVAGVMKTKVKLGMGYNSSCPKVLSRCLNSLERMKTIVNNSISCIENFKSEQTQRKMQRNNRKESKRVIKSNTAKTLKRKLENLDDDSNHDDDNDASISKKLKFEISRNNRKRKSSAHDNDDDGDGADEGANEIHIPRKRAKFERPSLKRKFNDGDNNSYNDDDDENDQPHRKVIKFSDA